MTEYTNRDSKKSSLLDRHGLSVLSFNQANKRVKPAEVLGVYSPRVCFGTFGAFVFLGNSMTDRAILFVDGNNWFHSLKGAGLSDLGRLDYTKISRKLVGPRQWVVTRYFIGALKHYHHHHGDQRRFLSQLKAQDERISIHYGRIEDKPVRNALAAEVRDLLHRHTVPIDLRTDLEDAVQRHRHVTLLKEKATDVLLAVDLCRAAWEDELDAAYLLSADGDYTPAVSFDLNMGKKIYAASPADCAALRNTASAYIPLHPAWFGDCYLE